MTTEITPTKTRGSGLPRWLIVALAVGVVVIVSLMVTVIVLLTEGGEEPSDAAAKASEPDSFTVTGTMSLESSDLLKAAGECFGDDGYDDMEPGAQVVIRDADGKSVAVGSLDTGIPDGPSTCDFRFRVEDVPSGSAIYSVEVSHRGEISFKEEDADGLLLSLG